MLATSPEAPRFDLVINARAHGSNPKISNLINMLPAAKHDVLVMADSDMEVGPDYLARIVAESSTMRMLSGFTADAGALL